MKPIDVSAFSLSKKTSKHVPSAFMKKKTGLKGSAGGPEEEEEAGWSEEGMKESVNKIQDFQAFAERPNPPNTEFRR